MQARCFIAFLLLMPTIAVAEPVIEQFDRFELNWSTMRMRFYGEKLGTSRGAAADKNGYRDSERGAWNEGLLYASKQVPEIFNAKVKKNPQAGAQAAERITTSTYSYNTIYYADGSVRVLLENLLPRALGAAHNEFAQADSPDTSNLEKSGVVLRVRGTESPFATYRVVAEGGQELFTVKDMAEDAFHRHLMGRWFKAPVTAQSLREAVGESAIELRGRFSEPGTLVVNGAEWRSKLAEYKDLLVAGRIALVLE